MTAATDSADLLSSARTALAAANERMTAATRHGFKTEEGGLVVSTEARAEFKSALGAAREATEIIKGLEFKGHVEGWLEQPEGRSSGVTHDAVAGGFFGALPSGLVPTGPTPRATPGQRFIDSPEFKSMAPNGDTAAFQLQSPLLEGMEFKDIHSGSIGTFTHPGFGSVERAAAISAPMRAARVRDLFPSARTNAVMIEYVEELGFVEPGDNAARTVAERTGVAPNDVFGLKPKSNIRFGTKQAPIRTIAHWVPAHRNTLNDEPQLRAIIDIRLMYGLKLEEDRQFLLGDGLGENILGILNVPGTQQYPGAATPGDQDTYVDAVRRAMTRVMLAEYEATGIVCHPYDWERMELTKDDNGQYVVAVNVAVGARKVLWQVPVIATPAIPEGTALTGAFGLGAQVYDREESNIRTSEHHEDFFVRNAVVILAEQRTGLVVWRPEAFVELDLLNAVPGA